MSKSTHEEENSAHHGDNPSSREEMLSQQVHNLQEQIDNITLSRSPALNPYNGAVHGAKPFLQNPNAPFGFNGSPNVPFHQAQQMPNRYAQNYDQGHYALPQTVFNNSHNYIPGSPYGAYSSPQAYPPEGFFPQQPYGENHLVNSFHNQAGPHFQQLHTSTSQPNSLNLIQHPQQYFPQQPAAMHSAQFPQHRPHYTAPMHYNQQILSPDHELPIGDYSATEMGPFSPQENFGDSAGPAFRLHQQNASTSRLDPPLELNRNLTNWGLTYGERTPRKTWAKPAFNSEQNVSEEDSREAPLEEFKQVSAPVAKLVHQQSPPTDPPHLKTAERSQSKNNLPVAVIVGDPTVIETAEMTAEMQAKRRALLASQLKRKEKVVALTEEKELEIAEKRQQEIEKQEQAEQRKLEQQLKRQKLLEDYKRKKLEQDMGEIASGSNSARVGSTTSLNRGHSQPPFGRPKSQSNMSTLHTRTLQRPNRNQSSMVMSNSVGDDENTTPRIHVPSIAEPTLKLFSKHQPKSNRILIINALQHSIFPGVVSNEQKNKVQAAMSMSDSKHFLVLFRDHKCQYRGLYTWDQVSDTAHRIDGTGPKICKEEVMTLMFKYDSGSKHFTKIPSKHLSATIDGFTIGDHFWLKPKIPHSSAR